MKQETLQLTGGNNKNDRRALDFYPTPKNVTIALMNFLELRPCKIWEPACGNGAMSKVIESYGHEVYSSDIRETGFGSPFLDFTKHTGDSNFDAIITNPPFKPSLQFILKAVEKAPIVAMMLKGQYWHGKNKQAIFNKYKPSYVLPLTWRPDFLEHERKEGEPKGSPTMEVIWTVWIKGDVITKYIPLPKPLTP